MIWKTGLAVAVAAALGACAQLIPPELPPNPPVTSVKWMDQNWSDTDRWWYHHETQGTSTLPIPYTWFMALEQPRLWLFGDAPMLSDSDYLSRFGFIPGAKGLEYADAAALRSQGYPGVAGAATYEVEDFAGNPGGLPVGFAVTKAYEDPVTGKQLPDQLGFTCAACHTGQMVYNGVNLRIDGGPAITELTKFRQSLGLALVYTEFLEARFNRFAMRVLKDAYNDQTAAALRAELGAVLKGLQGGLSLYAESSKHDVAEGFGRLDALNRIGNTVFVEDLVGAPNFDARVNVAALTAPVNYPHIWTTSWFKWVQYDASIEQPMVRNAGESMGVAARVNLSNPDRPLYASSVAVKPIAEMEELVAGADPYPGRAFKGLNAPKWPGDLFGEPDAAQVAQGEVLYQRHCQSCHLPPVDSAEFWDPTYWTTPNDAGQRYLKLPEVEVSYIGTDPAQANVLPTRKVQVPEYLGIDPNIVCDGKPEGVVTETLFGLALGVAVQKTVDSWYDSHDVPPAERVKMNGYRPNCLQVKEVYKARPLNGIWATAPFLHNGAVPDLEALLLPAAERPAQFCLGDRTFDPQRVGYVRTCAKGTTVIDTGIPGNLNTGHSFEDGPRGNGVIGPKLNPEEREALLAYLKTL